MSAHLVRFAKIEGYGLACHAAVRRPARRELRMAILSGPSINDVYSELDA
jgi:hypothetical protein